MSAGTSSGKKRGNGPDSVKSQKAKRVILEEDFDTDFSSDIKGILSALQNVREKAQKDGQNMKEDTISSLTSELKSTLDELKTMLEKERVSFARSFSKSSKECENLLKDEFAKFQAVYEQFSKDKATHLQAVKDAFAKYEEEKERLFISYEQIRKKEKTLLAEHEKACRGRIAELEESLKKKKKKKKKQDDKTFSILRKTLGSFLDNASDEDFPPDD